jgi:hypothetical protein
MEEGNLDVWLKSVNENEFDDQMDTYLATEKLVHYKDQPDIIQSISDIQNSVNIFYLTARLNRRKNTKDPCFQSVIHTILWK